MPNELVEPAALGHFSAPRGELQAVLHGAVVAQLPELGVIAVDGDDTVAFLQSQLTNDVAALGENHFQLNGYCTPKGRLVATFHQWREDSVVLLQLPGDLLPAVRKRLSMFVLRSKVSLVDASDARQTWAILGTGARDWLIGAGFGIPASPWSSTATGAIRVHRLPGAAPVDERYLLTMPSGESLPASLATLPRVSSAVWWWSEINAAIPTVFAATTEAFVPQMINFEVLGGVSFKKGCYPGQEIVARSQYLGKLKRRMHRAHVEGGAALAAGADLFQNGVVTGTVVLSASAPGGGVDLLFEAPSDRIAEASIHSERADGPVVNVAPLPYALFDPTA